MEMQPWIVGDVEIRFEKLNPQYAYSFVLYRDGKAFGCVFNTDGVHQYLATIAGATRLESVIRGMRHDIEIFYHKYREPATNQHYQALKTILNEMESEKKRAK